MKSKKFLFFIHGGYILILILAVNGSVAFSFPDMKNYPHDNTKVGETLSWASKSDDFVELSKTRFKGFNGYSGRCPMTKYHILIGEDLEEPECTIISPDNIVEKSYFYMEIELGKGYIAKYFYFKDKGRVGVVDGNEEVAAFWQSW